MGVIRRLQSANSLREADPMPRREHGGRIAHSSSRLRRSKRRITPTVPRVAGAHLCRGVDRLPAQPRRVDHGKVDPIDQHATAFGDVEALDQLGQRALARPRGSDHADDLPGGHAEIDVVEHLRPVDAVTKHDMVEHHVAANLSSVASAVHEAATRYLGWDMYWHEKP